MKIGIIGAGWYGLHTYCHLKKHHPDFTIKVFEKNDEIFKGSSLYNQNRLHLGYHYPRSHKTRELCLKGYTKFVRQYPSVITPIPANTYAIASQSLIDLETYKTIYDANPNFNHTYVDNTYLSNIDGDLIITNESFIDPVKATKHFLSIIPDTDLKLGYEVRSITPSERTTSKVSLNNDIECDLVLDCTNNQMGLTKEQYIYEVTLSLVYKKTAPCPFGALTIMDGGFFSIFPRNMERSLYTVTHVEHTPLSKSRCLAAIQAYEVNKAEITSRITKIEDQVSKIYPDFRRNFAYVDYFLSYKCKKVVGNESRECCVEQLDRIVSVNCGKITGIYEFEKHVETVINDLIQRSDDSR